MKIAILNDTHCGVRSDMVEMSKYQGRFYEEVFFPYLDEHNIKQIIHMGDYFDRRKYVNFASMKANIEHFVEPMNERGIKMDLILGNHDTYYKNTSEVNSMDELVSSFENVFKYSVNTLNPFFFDKLYAGSDPVGQISEFVVSVLNTGTHVYNCSPVFSVMERECVHVIADAFGFPRETVDGVANPGGTMSNMMAVLTARNEYFPHVRREGWKPED